MQVVGADDQVDDKDINWGDSVEQAVGEYDQMDEEPAGSVEQPAAEQRVPDSDEEQNISETRHTVSGLVLQPLLRPATPRVNRIFLTDDDS